MSTKDLLKLIAQRLERHPGDAPWSCVECYHNRPCMEKEILLAARDHLQLKAKPKPKVPRYFAQHRQQAWCVFDRQEPEHIPFPPTPIASCLLRSDAFKIRDALNEKEQNAA